MQRILFILLLFMQLIACKQSNSLQAFASEVPRAIASGQVIEHYLASSTTLSPEKRLAYHYKKLLKNWDYQPDPPGYDHFSPAERLIKKQSLSGDCEDFAIVMLSIYQALKLRCQLALGHYQNKGHIWAEVLLTRESLSSATQGKITRSFALSVSQVQRSNGYWLQFSPEGSLKKYTTTHTIDSLGNLQEIVQHPQNI